MIAALRGKVLQKSPGLVVVDVAGVGYEVQLSLRTWEALPGPGEEVQLLVQTIVREDAISLYGFADAREKELFLLLIGVSGIGPRLALILLGGLGGSALQAAIAGRDLTRLTAVPGVGKKIAQRICVELAEKAGHLDGSPGTLPGSVGPASAGQSAPQADAASALVNLGYAEQQVWQVLRALEQEMECTGFSMEDWLRQGLRRLAAR